MLLRWADGMYDGERCRLEARGTADQPIVIRAENMGKAVIKAPLLLVGDYISFVGLHFVEKGSVEIRGRGCRISRCVMTDVQVGKWIRVRGREPGG